MSSGQKLHARVALVTGGQRGLGAAIVREFAVEGATCIVNYPAMSERAEAEALVGQLASNGVQAVALEADVADSAASNDLIDKVLGAFGRLDILVNNAGVNSLGTWEEISRDTWDNTLSVNLTGLFNCCKYALPRV
jgi:NAD(P)-dependent dehydrogenase (short-subunit alcohol dehydrogenase family)